MMRVFLTVLLVVALMVPVWAQSTRIISSGTLPATCSVGSIYLKTGSSAGFYICLVANTWTGPLAVAGSGSALSSLTAATAANTIASGNNHSQIWNWALTSDSVNALAVGESAASTGGTSNNQVLYGINALATSTATPLYIKNYGTVASVRVDDIAADTTPFLIWENGQVSINSSGSPVANSMLRVDGGLSVESGGATVLVTNNGDIGTTTNDSLQFYTNNGNYQLVLSPSLYAELTRIGAAPASVTRANAYLHVGGNEFSANSFRAITFGYQPTGNTNVPAYVGYQETSVAGETEGDLLLATRAVTTDTAPTIRMRVDSEGTVILPSTSPTPAVSNTSANSCGTTAATIAGNNNTGVITVGATGGTDCTLTFTTTAPVGWNCSANNNTTGVPLGTIPTSTTVVRVVGVFAAADVLGYICFPR